MNIEITPPTIQSSFQAGACEFCHPKQEHEVCVFVIHRTELRACAKCLPAIHRKIEQMAKAIAAKSQSMKHTKKEKKKVSCCVHCGETLPEQEQGISVCPKCKQWHRV